MPNTVPIAHWLLVFTAIMKVLGLIIGTAHAQDREAPAVLLIGATAKSAPTFFEQSMERGYRVSGLARRPEGVEVKDERLKIYKGDVYDRATIEAALSGDEVVVSYLAYSTAGGPHQDILEDVDLFSKGIHNIIEAMKAKANKRLIVVSTTAIEKVFLEKPPENAPSVDTFMWNGRRKNDDMRRMETLIVASGLDYIIVRPAQVIGDESPGTPLNIAVNKNTYDPYNRKLTRPDLATFILDQVQADTYIGKVVGVYN